jgi:hypothetical protein
MRDINKYTNADIQLDLINNFKSDMKSKLDNCEDISSAKTIRDEMLEQFNENCLSNIVRKHIVDESEILIKRKFKNG